MGNQQTIPFQMEPWQLFKIQANCILLRNKQTNEIVQKYLTQKEDQSRGDQPDLYKWRCNLNPQFHVVEVFQYGVKSKSSCTQIDQVYVITEHIQKFKRMPIMSKPESFLFLKHIIQGLMVLKSKFGLFSPTPYHIGVNKFGQGKVWINDNFASNQVQLQALVGKFEQTVVNNLCKLIQTKVLNKQPTQISYPHHMDFKFALQYISRLLENDTRFQVKKIKTTLALKQNHIPNLEEDVTKSQNQNTDHSRNTNQNFQVRTNNTNKNNISNISYSVTPPQPLFMIPQRRQSSYDSNSRVSRNSYNSRKIQQLNQKSELSMNKNHFLQTIHEYPSKNFVQPIQYYNSANIVNNIPSIHQHHQYVMVQHHPVQYFRNEPQFVNRGYNQSPLINNTQKPYNQPQRVIQPHGQHIPMHNIQKKNHIKTNQQRKVEKRSKPPLPNKNISIYSELRIKEDLQQVDSVILIPQEV